MTEMSPAERETMIDGKLTRYWAADERGREFERPSDAATSQANDRAISKRDLRSFKRPAPALSPAQRLHLDVYGYVVIEGMFTSREVDELRDDIYEIERGFRAGDTTSSLRPAFLESESLDYFRIDNLPHIGPSFFDYLTHPGIVGIAEEIIGGPARLSQSDAHIRRASASPESQQFGFHRGSCGMAGTIANGLYHFPFVKALTNLTDLGPDDGGTTVIPGTHKIPNEADLQSVIAAAMADPTLIHQVEAPAGSTLVFFESLLHSSGIIRSGHDRVLILGGYTPHMFAACVGMKPSAELVQRLPDEYQRFFLGWYSYFWPGIKPRALADERGA